MERFKKPLFIFGPILLIGGIWSAAFASDTSFPILFNLTFGLIMLVGYAYLAVKQFIQVLRPRDFLTRLRVQIFSVLMISIITFIPSLVYQFVRLSGDESEFLRAVVNILSRVSSLCVLIILIAVFNYRQKGGE